MLAIIGILFVVLAIIFIEFSSIKEKKFKKEMYLFILFLLVGIGLNVINTLHIKFPNLLDWLIFVYKPISRLVFN